jgi:hypothetical protein
LQNVGDSGVVLEVADLKGWLSEFSELLPDAMGAKAPSDARFTEKS